MLFEQKTWKTWKNETKHHTSPKPMLFSKFVTKVLTAVVRNRHQVRQLASWDAPHHPLGLSPKKRRKNNANGAVRSRAYGQRLWGAYNRLSQEAMVKPSSQSSPYTFCHVYMLSKLVLFCSLWLILFIVLSSHSNSNSCQTGEMFRWKVCRQSQTIHRKSTPPWLPQTVATWPCSQWQREKNTLCVKNTVFFPLMIYVIYTLYSFTL